MNGDVRLLVFPLDLLCALLICLLGFLWTTVALIPDHQKSNLV
jgi:hypothetical protein